ncbi:hypothetical protein [Nocardiopsis sp. MG754419]|uniref:hypothetical protein n=1 Tax=Nocardiopsis sp. MG754419 TaxID=2259865 RepID=UPI001BAD020E|nr:hypothetical protein [Nocardiopsis sp. MG754419]MBR8745428.1 hypothetical protein [Nocardiopsis sp. MG754419]
MAARLLSRPTRADLWITLTLLVLSVVSTAGIETIDPVPGDRPAWPWGYALILLACLPLPWRTARPRGVGPGLAEVFVWSLLLPAIPVMLLGQVWLYRMTRRPAPEPTFFA